LADGLAAVGRAGPDAGGAESVFPADPNVCRSSSVNLLPTQIARPALHPRQYQGEADKYHRYGNGHKRAFDRHEITPSWFREIMVGPEVAYLMQINELRCSLRFRPKV
jgi:hypothetical protein